MVGLGGFGGGGGGDWNGYSSTWQMIKLNMLS